MRWMGVVCVCEKKKEEGLTTTFSEDLFDEFVPCYVLRCASLASVYPGFAVAAETNFGFFERSGRGCFGI